MYVIFRQSSLPCMFSLRGRKDVHSMYVKRRLYFTPNELNLWSSYHHEHLFCRRKKMNAMAIRTPINYDSEMAAVG